MSFISRLIIILINYISIIGLLVCGLFALFIKDNKRKLLFLFLCFLFAGLLSFVYYSDILFFTAGIMMLFFFMLLYLFVLQKDFFRRPGSGDPGKEFKVPARSKILNIIIPFLCCAAAGYFIYEYVSGFLKGVKVAEDGGNIFIADWSDISNYFFTNYSLVLIIITASLFMSFLWFLAVKAREK